MKIALRPRRQTLYRLTWAAALLLLAIAVPAFAQETAAQETAALDVVTRWKIINALIFVAGLGWAIWKYAPAFFNARSAEIQKAIQDATGLKIQADFRYSEIDRKMAGLADEIRRLRHQAGIELERDHARFRQETAIEIQHIQHNLIAEIEAFRQEGIRKLREHTAQVALGLAEWQFKERFQAGEPEDMFGEFIHLVESGKN